MSVSPNSQFLLFTPAFILMTFFCTCAVKKTDKSIQLCPSHWPLHVNIVLVCTIMYMQKYIYDRGKILYHSYPSSLSWVRVVSRYPLLTDWAACDLQHVCRRLKVMSPAQQREGFVPLCYCKINRHSGMELLTSWLRFIPPKIQHLSECPRFGTQKANSCRIFSEKGYF